MSTFTHTFPFDFHGQQVEATVEYTVEPGLPWSYSGPAEGPTLRGIKVFRVGSHLVEPSIGIFAAAETMAQALWDEGKLPTDPEDNRTGHDD